jgi:hypothetical protein
MYGGQPVEMGNGAMFANANPLNDPRLKIKGGEPWTKRPLLPGEKDPAENIPFQFLPPSPGQGARLAQALPGAAGNQAGNLGGMMSTGSSAMPGQEMMLPRSPYGPKPFNLDINGVDNRLENLNASANIQLDPNQLVQIGGEYAPGYRDQMGTTMSPGYGINASYQTPGVNINARYRKTPQAGYSIYGGLDARF